MLFLLLLCLYFTCPSAVLLGVFLVFFVRLSGIQCNTLAKYFQFQFCLCVVVVSARSLALWLFLSLSWGLAYLAYSAAMLAFLFLQRKENLSFPSQLLLGFGYFCCSSSIFYKFLIIFKYLFCYCLLLALFVSKFMFVVFVRKVCSKHARTHTHTQAHTRALRLL